MMNTQHLVQCVHIDVEYLILVGHIASKSERAIPGGGGRHYIYTAYYVCAANQGGYFNSTLREGIQFLIICLGKGMEFLIQSLGQDIQIIQLV
jgi:hypothetical protein